MSNATDIRQSGGTAGSVDHTDTSRRFAHYSRTSHGYVVSCRAHVLS